MTFRFSLVVSIFYLLFNAAPLVAASGMQNAPVSPDFNQNELSEDLRHAVMNAEKSLSELEPWQKNIFLEEVVPQYQRFIKDYSKSRIEVDLDGIKNYLKFYAPNLFKGDALRFFVALKVDTQCEVCVQNQSKIQTLVKDRLERRGLIPVWSTAGEQNYLSNMAKSKGAAGYLLVGWEPVPVDDLDSVHADEKKYRIQLVFSLRGMPQHEERMEVMDQDRFENSVARLLTNAFGSAGAKFTSIKFEQSGKKNEVEVAVKGIKTFAQWMKLKTILQERLQGVGSVMERSISKGQGVFALKTNLQATEIKLQIEKLKTTQEMTEPAMSSVTVAVEIQGGVP